jgi:hypothetical protein
MGASFNSQSAVAVARATHAHTSRGGAALLGFVFPVCLVTHFAASAFDACFAVFFATFLAASFAAAFSAANVSGESETAAVMAASSSPPTPTLTASSQCIALLLLCTPLLLPPPLM